MDMVWTLETIFCNRVEVSLREEQSALGVYWKNSRSISYGEINSFNIHLEWKCSFTMCYALFQAFYVAEVIVRILQMEKTGRGQPSNLSKVTQLVSSRKGIWIQATCLAPVFKTGKASRKRWQLSHAWRIWPGGGRDGHSKQNSGKQV